MTSLSVKSGWQKRTKEVSDSRAGFKGCEPTHTLHCHWQDKQTTPVFNDWHSEENERHLPLCVISQQQNVNPPTLASNPPTEVDPRLCKQSWLSFCSGEHEGRLETTSNMTEPVWIPGCKENTESQMKSDTVQIPPWQQRLNVLSGTLSAVFERSAARRQKRWEIQL